MEKRPVVVLLGDSLLMDGVAMSLRSDLQLGVVQMTTTIPDIGERLISLQPTLIVFELDRAASETLLPLLKEQPDALLLGLNPGCCQVVMVESNRCLVHSMQEFCQLVQKVSEGRCAGVSAGDPWG